MGKYIYPVLIIWAVCAVPVWGAGFFEIAYAADTSHTKDFEDGLADAPGFGVFFGYETELVSSSVLFDLELGYEVSTHELKKPFDDPDYYYRNHRGVMGLRVKYGGLGWVEPYIGLGSIVYAFYDNSDKLADPPMDFPNFEIAKNFSGMYTVVGIDFFFSRQGNYSLGIELRTMDYSVKDTDDGSVESDIRVRRVAFKFSVLF